MLDQALLLDDAGRPFTQNGPTFSEDWDQVAAFCRQVYMPFRVQPAAPHTAPAATMRSAQIGRITLTRFAYGVPVHLDRFDPDAGNILVLNTLRGALRHQQDGGQHVSTAAGDSFVVDCSRTDYWLDADASHMQLNLTIPHDVVENIATRWLGGRPDPQLWTQRVAFGGTGSRWHTLLAYAVRSIQADGSLLLGTNAAAHLEEMLCVELLQAWSERAGLPLRAATAAAPHYVCRAEQIMAAEAAQPPTIGAIAERVGVSTRALSDGFRRTRGMTPQQFLRQRRLEGFHRALQQARSGDTVTAVAADWGFVNLGALAKRYYEHFGQLPSRTLAQRRHN